MRIGLLTDLHYRGAVPGTSAIARRECRRMSDVLDQALGALVAAGADLVICAGDCVDTEDDPRALEDLAGLGERFAAGGLPWVVVAGNHDPPPDAFYRVVPRPPRRSRAGDCELLTFGEDAFDNRTQLATRSDADLAWLQETLTTPAPEVALTVVVQHYTLFPEHTGPGYRHTYANDAAIRAVLEASTRPVLALSGHNHRGSPLMTHRGVRYLTGRALCEYPYPYVLLHTEGAEVQVEERTVASGGAP
jgi:3',5'-cyclic AMP phosphodiesterase CpdA